MRRAALVLLAVVSFTGFIVPASKMAELMKARGRFKALVFNGDTFFNIGNDYLNRAVPCRVVITPSGYVRQDYKFPKAVVSIINEGTKQTMLINNVRIGTSLPMFSRNNVFALLMGLFLSNSPGNVFNEMGLDSTKVAYGLADNRAAYIIGNDNDQMFIDNEQTVPLMFRVKYNNAYLYVVVKNYLNTARLIDGSATIKDRGPGGGIPLRVGAAGYTETAVILPQTVELYRGDMLVQRWLFTDAVLFPAGTGIKKLVLTPYEIKRLPFSRQRLSPFMLF